MTETHYRSDVYAALALALVAGLTFWIYSAAFTADFNFDDVANLTPLEFIRGLDSAIPYIFDGHAGPLGRPIALATFALQFSAWPRDPEEFIYANTLIHVINGLLVAWFGLRLARMLPGLRDRSRGFAVTLCSLWLLQPMLASASLMVVQRMATLSSTFMLLGLAGYLIGREKLRRAEKFGFGIMITSIALGTLLAIFTKETGALLPIYVWVLEYTVFDGERWPRFLRYWKRLLHLPVILLVAYACLQLPHLFEETHRGFSPYQRLITESRILWIYLRLILLPRASEFGPFHDDFAYSEDLLTPLSTLFSAFAWIIVIGVAVAVRKRLPWFSLATGWFLLGHSLESSLFNLELYFEHRNYLASIGPLAGLAKLVWSTPHGFRRGSLIALAGYLALVAFVLRQLTLGWGNTFVSAEIWADAHPLSDRAQQFHAQRFVLLGDQEKAAQIIEHARMANPASAALSMQAIQLRCYFGLDVSDKLALAMPVLEHAKANFGAFDPLEKLLDMQSNKSCPGLTSEVLLDVTDALLKNPKYWTIPLVAFRLYHYKARLYFDRRELDPTVRSLEQAFAAKPDLETAVLIIGLLDNAGLYGVAQQKISEFEAFAPSNPLLRQQWQRRFESLRGGLEKR